MELKNIFRKRKEKKEDKEAVMALERDIIMALRQVYDPEIPVNIYDLGLIYELKVDGMPLKRLWRTSLVW